MAKGVKRGRKAPPRVRRKPVAPPQRGGERYELAMRAINEGVYDWDVANGSMHYSEGVYTVLHMPRSMKTPAHWRARIHPDDLPAYDAAILAHFKKKTERFECDYRYRARDRSWRWARQHGVALRDARGRAIRMIGSIGDISELKRVEQALKESEQRYALATEASTEGIYEWNVEAGVLYLSEAAKRFFAFAADAFTPVDWNARIHPEDFPGYRAAVVECFKGRTARVEREYRIRNALGGWSWVLDRGVAVRNPAGRATRLVGAMTDITQRKLAEAELRQARDEATEALERQTATAEILKVISNSPADIKPTFKAILESTTRVCESSVAALFLFDGELLTCAAHHNTTAVFAKALQQMRSPPSRETATRLAALERRVVHVHDYRNDPRFRPLPGHLRENARTLISVPLLREGSLVGVITTWRREVKPFADKQIALLQTFADQAVIAIQNVRLFNETKEALEQQTATSNVLREISRSTFDLNSVLQSLLDSAMRLSGASTSAMFLPDRDDAYSLAVLSGYGPDSALEKALRSNPIRPGRDTTTGRALIERRTVHTHDIRSEAGYRQDLVALASYRTNLAVPMLRDRELVGVITLTRGTDVNPFTDKQIELVEGFAAQAVIAIENVRLFNETKEALERQTATAEILRVISGSPTDTQPVFDAILERATKLCDAYTGILFRHEDGAFHALATRIPDPEFEAKFREPRRPAPGSNTGLGRLIREKRAVHIPDAADDAAYREGDPMRLETLKGGMRTWLGVPMLKDGELTGAIVIYRSEPRPFSDQQISLLQTFADQAVIAIDNVRLFNETREALEQQTATSEILRVISSSPNDLSPVFDAILDHATRLCEAQLGFAFMSDGQAFDPVAQRGLDSEKFAAWSAAFRPHRVPGPLSGLGKLLFTKGPVLIADVADDEAYRVRDPLRVLTVEAIGARTFLAVPLLKESSVIGAVVIYRREVRPFSDKQIALLQTFADQAVIAIENVRLFNETKEALKRQTATAEILKVISSTPTDVHPVFDAIMENAMRLCDANLGTVGLYDGKNYHHVAQRGGSPEYAGWLLSEPFAPDPAYTIGRMIAERRPVHIPDYRELREYRERNPRAVATAELGGARTFLAVPMLKDGGVVGGITVRRTEVRPFTQKQIDLVSTFASQAVIAIENVRLFNETKEALERQTATAEILKVIAGSPTDVQPVFNAIAASALRLFGGHASSVTRVVGDMLHLAAFTATSEAGNEALKTSFPRPLSSPGLHTMAALSRKPAYSIDFENDPEVAPEIKAVVRARGIRSQLTVPMLREEVSIGTIAVTRTEPGRFSDHQISLMEIFASQAVIAIENVRLFNETKEALEQQTATAEILKVISSSPTDTQPVFDAIVQSALRLFNGQGVGILLADGDRVQLGSAGGIIDLETARKRYPLPLNRDTVSGQAIVDRSFVNIADSQAPEMPELVRSLGQALGYRAAASAPMMREGVATGAITVVRKAPGALAEKEIALLKTFADQAVIAIENVRLFKELDARNRDVTEALERQTATAEILRVIGGSMTDTQPVFDAIVKNCGNLFKGSRVVLWLIDADRLHPRASNGEFSVESMPIDRESAIGVCVLDGGMIHLPDLEKAAAQYPRIRQLGLKFGYRSGIYAPLLREARAIGGISVLRYESGAFDDKALALLNTFADQAVIAIENVRLFNETKESLERQTATAEILEVIASSPTDVQPVFDAIAACAVRLFGGQSATVTRVVGDMLQLAALTAGSETGVEAVRSSFPTPLSSDGIHSRVARTGAPAFRFDIETEPDISPGVKELARARGYRSILAVPLLREGVSIGTIAVTRRDPGQFSDHQISLLKTFADQAVIAIENVRLFNETKEALERQTATAEILKVIASSPSDVQPVFDAIAASALKLIAGSSAVVVRRVGDALHLAAHTATSASGDEALKKMYPVALTGQGVVGKAVLSLTPTYVSDFETDSAYSPSIREMARARGTRSMLAVPMVREGAAMGAINVTRSTPGAFTDHQINLVRTFADQAVIAIENVRLFNETKEALERQTATAEILKVISSSPTDAQPVFEAIVQSGLKLFSGAGVGISIVEGAELRVMAAAGNLPAAARGLHLPISQESASGMAIVERRVVNIRDTEAPDVPPHARDNGRKLGIRSMTQAPMFREGEPVGVIGVTLKEPGGLDDKQLALLKTFADQAVIAIENVRLFKELQTRTEALTRSVGQLTALGEVGQAVSSSLDLESVLKTIVSRAVQLTGLDGGSIYEYDERTEEFHLHATENVDEEYLALLRRTPIRKGEGAVGRAGLTGEPTQISDVRDQSIQSRLRDAFIRAGYRAVLVVPLLREEHIIGALSVTRKAPGPFAPEIVELLKTFATQSALAIQNARLFREIAEKGKQLEVASRHKSDFLASMSHELRTPLNAILGFNEMILGQVYGEVPADMKDPLTDIQASGKHLLRLINNVLDLAKIEAGRMELSLQDYSVQDTVESVRSTLRPLAAEKGLEFHASVPNDLPLAYGDGGRIAQCLMNLAGNSLKFTKAGKVEISVEQRDQLLVFRVADTGIGIPPDKIASLFTEFKQTDATIASEYGGTGLGLSISKKFVEMHGGRIWVESEPGRGSVFIFEIPLRAGAP